MGWVTTKLLGYVCGGLLLALLAVSTYAYTQHQVAERRQAETRETKLALSIALTANKTATTIIKGLEAERDAFVLKRAMEQEEVEQVVSRSLKLAAAAGQELAAARKRIKTLSLSTNCMAVMSAPICPEIERELRAP